MIAPIFAPVIMSAAITSVYAVIAPWIPVTVVPTSFATVAMETFITDVSSVIRNWPAASVRSTTIGPLVRRAVLSPGATSAILTRSSDTAGASEEVRQLVPEPALDPVDARGGLAPLRALDVGTEQPLLEQRGGVGASRDHRDLGVPVERPRIEVDGAEAD